MTPEQKVFSNVLLEELKPRATWSMRECLAAGGFPSDLSNDNNVKITVRLLDIIQNRQTLFGVPNHTTLSNTQNTVSLRKP